MTLTIAGLIRAVSSSSSEGDAKLNALRGIDKRSSAELSESINSMYNWYKNAAECLVYLSDVPRKHWTQSLWWSRGWTLQELLAPRNVIFYDRKWNQIGTKTRLKEIIKQNTGISAKALDGLMPSNFPISARMRWASHRVTSRIEDLAYCLMGLFNVNMPLLYGEGSRAFTRLQEEILRRGTSDHSLYAWKLTNSANVMYHGFLAPSPAEFHHREADEFAIFDHLPQEVSSGGIKLTVLLRPHRNFPGVYQAVLNYAGGHPCAAIQLLRIPKMLMSDSKSPITKDDVFVRIDSDKLYDIHESETREFKMHTIHVRNVVTEPYWIDHPGATLHISVGHLHFEMIEILGKVVKTGPYRMGMLLIHDLYVNPAKGKLVGLYMRRATGDNFSRAPFLITIGINSTCLPWCKVSYPRNVEDAKAAYNDFQPNIVEVSRIYRGRDKMVEVGLQYFYQKIRLVVDVNCEDDFGTMS